MLRNTKGFTLIELMVVILIIGILAALAIPKFTNASAKAKMSEVPTICAAYENAQLARVAETSELGTLAQLVFEAPGDSGTTKWFTWADNGSGTYTATANNDMGEFEKDATASTNVTTAGVVTHASSDSLAVVKLLPNFLK
ncbi:MAG TPA: type II secretion system protein [Chitinispirillaceae bacterium]|nr:type II secretion system protein [Chitinispirillaceae bacterium]